VRAELQRELAQVLPVARQIVYQCKRPGRIARQNGLRRLGQDVGPHQTQESGCRLGLQAGSQTGNRPIQQALAIPQAPRSRLSHGRDGPLGGADPLGHGDLAQMVADLGRAQQSEVVPLAARMNRGENLCEARSSPRMNTTRGGGSSSVLRSALKELAESMWASSMM